MLLFIEVRINIIYHHVQYANPSEKVRENSRAIYPHALIVRFNILLQECSIQFALDKYNMNMWAGKGLRIGVANREQRTMSWKEV